MRFNLWALLLAIAFAMTAMTAIAIAFPEGDGTYASLGKVRISDGITISINGETIPEKKLPMALEAKKGDVLTLAIDLRLSPAKDLCGMFFNSHRLNVAAYGKDGAIEDTGSGESIYRRDVPIFIPLGDSDEIRLEFTIPEGSSVGMATIPELYLCSWEDYMSFTLIESAAPASIGIGFALVALIIASSSFLFSESEGKSTLISLSALFFVAFLWVIPRTNGFLFLVNSCRAADEIANFALFLLPLAISFHLKQIAGRGSKGIASASCIASILVMWLYVVASFLTIFHISEYLLLFGACAFVPPLYLLLLSVVMLASPSMRRTGEAKRGMPILLLSIAILIDLLLFAISSEGISGLISSLLYAFSGIAFIYSSMGIALKSTSSLRHRERMLGMSYTDPLTGLLNRRAYENRLNAIEKQPYQSLGIVVIDINDMKTCNDNLGHDAGDRLIKALSTAITSSEMDLECHAFRVGGDEFTLIFRLDSDFDQEEFLSKLRANFDHFNPFKDFSYSAGFGSYAPENGIPIREVIRRTDEKMYYAKLQAKRSRQLYGDETHRVIFKK